MIAALMNGGRSFKGAAAYYLHDKRQPGEQERDTTERIAWTHCVNLATDDPEKAWRMMAHTAMAQGEIKAAAGVKAGGRKLTQPVCSYVLSWHEDDAPTREEQLTAALETLKVLGLDDRQAVIVAHNDTAHPHVHVIANRVSPENGIAAPLSKSKEKLQAWALEHEKARGQIRCDARAEKAEKRQRGEDVENTSRKPRPVFEFEKAAENDNLRADFIRAEQKRRDAALHQATRDMRDRHRERWRSTKAAYADGKAKLWTARKHGEAMTADRIKEEFKPQWAALFRRQQDEARELARQSSTIGGRLKRWFADKVGRRYDSEEQERGLVAGAFNAAVSGDSLRRAMERRHEAERRSLAEYRKEAIKTAQRPIGEAHKAAAERVRAQYLDVCGDIKRQQDAEQAAMRDAWRQRNAERREAFAQLREQGRDDDQARDRTADRERSRPSWARDDRERDGDGWGRERGRGREPG